MWRDVQWSVGFRAALSLDKKKNQPVAESVDGIGGGTFDHDRMCGRQVSHAGTPLPKLPEQFFERDRQDRTPLGLPHFMRTACGSHQTP